MTALQGDSCRFDSKQCCISGYSGADNPTKQVGKAVPHNPVTMAMLSGAVTQFNSGQDLFANQPVQTTESLSTQGGKTPTQGGSKGK